MSNKTHWQSGGNWTQSTGKAVKHTPKPACHNGKVAIVKGAKASLYAAGTSRGYNPDISKEALIDLAGSYHLPGMFGGKNWGIDTSIPDNYLQLFVRDYQAPAVGAEVIVHLAGRILNFINTGTDVVIYCVGGHGRTGTVVSALLPLVVANPQETLQPNPVAWLREHYCKEVVESKEQLKWIKDIVSTCNPGMEFDWSGVEIEEPTWQTLGSYDAGKVSVWRSCVVCKASTKDVILGTSLNNSGSHFAHYCKKCAEKSKTCAICDENKDNVHVVDDPKGGVGAEIIICEECLVIESADAVDNTTKWFNIYGV